MDQRHLRPQGVCILNAMFLEGTEAHGLTPRVMKVAHAHVPLGDLNQTQTARQFPTGNARLRLRFGICLQLGQILLCFIGLTFRFAQKRTAGGAVFVFCRRKFGRLGWLGEPSPTKFSLRLKKCCRGYPRFDKSPLTKRRSQNERTKRYR